MSPRPAWSAAFEADALPSLERIGPPEQITREWAWGGSTGAGVKVAVIDSGVDADHPAVGGRVEYAAIVEDGDEIRRRPRAARRRLRPRHRLRRDHPQPRARLRAHEREGARRRA